MWLILSWRPVFPRLDAIIARILASITGCLSGYVVVGDGRGDHGDVVDSVSQLRGQCNQFVGGCFSSVGWVGAKAVQLRKWLKENHAPEFFKIFLTYFQILGSFQIYSVEWPSGLLKFISVLQMAFKFDILQLPILSCLWEGVTFRAYLQAYTIAPLAVCAGFAMPVLVAYLKGMRTSSKLRWRRTLDRFWTNTVFLMFCIYPAVSLASVLAFNCDENVGRMKDFFRELCPSRTDPVWIHSMIFVVLYPIGIPVFMNLSMRHMGIVALVKAKMDDANFNAMLSFFIKDAASTEAQRISRLVGHCEGDPTEFERQARHAFENLCKKQGGGDCIIIESLKEAAEHAHGVEGTTIKDLVNFFVMFDENGDGKIDFDEFKTMVRASVDATNLFVGSEELNKLSERQIEALLLYDWPEKYEGLGDVDDFQGLGGLVEQLKKESQQQEEPESDEGRLREIEERRTHIEEGDRSDKHLIALDNLAEELQDMEDDGLLLEATFTPDWRTEVCLQMFSRVSPKNVCMHRHARTHMLHVSCYMYLRARACVCVCVCV